MRHLTEIVGDARAERHERAVSAAYLIIAKSFRVVLNRDRGI
jgi:hypothetical protein